MTSAPLTSTSTSTQRHPRPAKPPPPRACRLVLVAAGESSGRGDELIRRYRLARLRLEPREVRGDERFAHLKQSHD